MIRSRFSLAACVLLFAVATQAQSTATVTCKDGSSSKGGKGACSRHGGIATAAKVDAKADSKMKAAPSAAPTKMAAAPAPAATAPTKMAAAAPATAPAAAPAKAGGTPTATCKDGTQSFAKNHSGACSKHGGVKEWLDGSAKKP